MASWCVVDKRCAQVVIPKHSAILPGYPAIGIHSNHTDMAKFSSADDPGFKAVCGELNRWMEDIKMNALEADFAEMNKAANTEGPRKEPARSSDACKTRLKPTSDAS